MAYPETATNLSPQRSLREVINDWISARTASAWIIWSDSRR